MLVSFGDGKPGVTTVAETGPPATAYADVLLRGVPHIHQKPDFCGEACAAMWLGKLGRAVDQDQVFDLSGVDPREGRGCRTRDLAAALGALGFAVGPVWYSVPAAGSEATLEALWRGLYADLVAGVPSIVCMHYDDRPGSSEHFRLVLGYDRQQDAVIFHEPAEVDGAYRRMDRATLLRLWPLKYDPRRWTVVRLRLEAKRSVPVAATHGFTAADFAQHMMKLKPKIPGDDFTVVIQPPFVVLGDESPRRVRERAEQTVKWAVDRLKEAYFEKDPKQILDIWLFADKASYEAHTKEIFAEEPTTPYGYFSAAQGALVMNIATGGGTLVHEIVHPFVATDFPACPAWLNEGLGSLYEQSGEVDGKIHGYTNWRLAGLQDAIRRGRLSPLETLCSTTLDEFYRDPTGTNYAQARYLCYYLQEHRLLRTFYRRFRSGAEKDPTGYRTLAAVLGEEEMQAFQKKWEAYVLKLTFP